MTEPRELQASAYGGYPFIILSEAERRVLLRLLSLQPETTTVMALRRKIGGPNKRVLVEMPL